MLDLCAAGESGRHRDRLFSSTVEQPFSSREVARKFHPQADWPTSPLLGGLLQRTLSGPGVSGHSEVAVLPTLAEPAVVVPRRFKKTGKFLELSLHHTILA